MLKPYYQDEWATIYHGDCREILPCLDPVDLVLTDPPYNVGIDYNGNGTDSRDDYGQWCTEWFRQVTGKSKAVVFTPGIANLGLWLPMEPRWVAAWVKDNSMRRATLGFNCWEPILVFGKPELSAYRDVFTAPTIPQSFGHPTPKPLPLFKALIAAFTAKDWTVLDPFMGSGTTLRAAKDMGLKSIGIEIEEKYCEIAVNRLRQESLLGIAEAKPQARQAALHM